VRVERVGPARPDPHLRRLRSPDGRGATRSKLRVTKGTEKSRQEEAQNRKWVHADGWVEFWHADPINWAAIIAALCDVGHSARKGASLISTSSTENSCHEHTHEVSGGIVHPKSLVAGRLYPRAHEMGELGSQTTGTGTTRTEVV
jgi:hypothetical protein